MEQDKKVLTVRWQRYRDSWTDIIIIKKDLILGLLSSFSTLVDERLVNVWDDTTTSNGSLDQGIQFFITPNSQLQVTWCDTFDLKILAGISGQFKNFGCQIFQDGGGVNGSGSTDTMSLMDRILQETVNTTDWKLKSSLGTSRLWCLLACWGFSTLSSLSTFSSFARL